MGWFILANIFSALLTLIRISFRSDPEKDLEILILRQQLHILQRKRNQTVKPDRVDKMILGVFAAKLKLISEKPVASMRAVIRIFQPETVLRWHQELVRLKWTYKCKNKGGRPLIEQELVKPDPVPGKGEPTLGIWQDRRRTHQIGLHGIANDDPENASQA